MPLRAILAMEIYQHDNLLTPAEGAPTGSGAQPKQGPASKVPQRAARILLGAASPSLATGLMVGPSERIAEISESMVVTSESMVGPCECMVGSRDPSESMVGSFESMVGPSESMV